MSQHHCGPACTRLSPKSQGRAACSCGTSHGRDPGTMSQSLAHHTSTLQQGTALPARQGAGEADTGYHRTTLHRGKLRHDDFKHSSTGQAWLCALPDTTTSVIPRDKAPRGVVPAGTAPRGAVPRGILPRGVELRGTQISITRRVALEEIERHNIQGGVTSGGMPLPQV